MLKTKMNNLLSTTFRKAFYCLLFIPLIVSCTDDTSTQITSPISFFIEANVNGQIISHKISPIGIIENNYFGGTALQIAGPNSPTFSFTVEGSTTITEKTYAEIDNGTILIFNYNISEAEHYHSQMGDEEDFVFTITEIGNGYFSGTFSGTIRNVAEPYSPLNISNGKFKLQLN